MDEKVRIVNGPIPTDDEGRQIQWCVSWYSEAATTTRFYDSSLVNDAKPESRNRTANPRQAFMARAERILEKNARIFRELA